MGKELQPMDISAPGQNLEAYLNSIQNIAILSPEEERKLAEDLYYREDLEAARQLVMAHLRFVVHIARGYSGYGLPRRCQNDIQRARRQGRYGAGNGAKDVLS